MHRIDVSAGVGQCGHGARGSEEAREQHEQHDEEPHDEDGLLHGVAVVGDDESERREEQGQEHGEDVDEPDRTGGCDAIDEPGQQQADGDDKEGDEPVRDEFVDHGDGSTDHFSQSLHHSRVNVQLTAQFSAYFQRRLAEKGIGQDVSRDIPDTIIKVACNLVELFILLPSIP